MDLKKLFNTNRKSENDGVWVDIGSGARVKVARDTAPRYRERLRDVLRPYRGAISAGALTDEQSHALFCKAAAGTMLIDWSGIEIDGVPTEFSVEAAERMLVDLPDFYRLIEGFARDATLFRDAAEAAERKN